MIVAKLAEATRIFMVSGSLTDRCYEHLRNASPREHAMLIVCPTCSTTYQI